MDTKGDKTNSRTNLHQREQKHPDEWQRDLNPNHMAGQSISDASIDREQGLQTAYDIRELHNTLDRIPDDELKKVPILPDGARLQQGATYIDLRNDQPEEFTAMGDMATEPGRWYVPKDQVPYPVWNRLLGRERPGGTVNEADMGPNTG
jgi:hypothetical protein